MKKQPDNSRRKFILNSALGTAGLALGMAGVSSFVEGCATPAKLLNASFLTGFDQQPLPYSYNGLEDVIDARTMEIHYSKHAAAYSKALKEALAAEAKTETSVETILGKVSKYSAKIGSFEAMQEKFNAAGAGRFGSGWAWLYIDSKKKLQIGSTPNQDNPLMDLSEIKGFPVLGLDVWEHAYYLKYQNKRADYISNWWNVVNWDYVQQRYDSVS